MKESWIEYKMGELVSLKQGFALNKKSDHYISEKPTKFPLLKISDLLNGTETLFVKDTIPSQFLVGPSEIIYSRTGQVGYAFMGKKGVVYNNCFKVIPNERIDSVFLFHLLNSQPIRELAKVLATGSAQPDLNHDAFKSIKVQIPPLPTQRKIAAILSAYDDLIENNLRRIKLLEEKAQLTYEEWFVRMKFPGHDSTPINEETGLPEGWERIKCFDAMEVLSGGTPKTSIEEYWNGKIQFFTPKDASNSAYTNGTEKRISDDGLKKCNSKLYPKNTVFITARGTVGKLNLSAEPMAMNQSCYALKGKKGISQFFLYSSMQSIIDSFKGAASGGVFDTIVVDTFRYLPFVLPSLKLVEEFTKIAEPLFNSILIIQSQNQLLKETRDILLPRLMTGMIDVDGLDLSAFGIEEREEMMVAAEPEARYSSKNKKDEAINQN